MNMRYHNSLQTSHNTEADVCLKSFNTLLPSLEISQGEKPTQYNYKPLIGYALSRTDYKLLCPLFPRRNHTA